MQIKKYRELRGFSQEELARRSGLSQAMISAAERGEKDLTVRKAERVAGALGVKLEKLVEDDEAGMAFPKPGSSGRS